MSGSHFEGGSKKLWCKPTALEEASVNEFQATTSGDGTAKRLPTMPADDVVLCVNAGFQQPN